MHKTYRMQVIKTTSELQRSLQNDSQIEQNIGFVPTMGALHTGHLSLVETSVRDNDLTVASIYINPTQFSNADDLKNYPQTLDDDYIKVPVVVQSQ